MANRLLARLAIARQSDYEQSTKMSSSPHLVTVLVPCRNEHDNLPAIYAGVRAAAARIPDVRIELLFIDNASSDGTEASLRGLAATDPAVKVILNARNFGHVRSPFHGLLAAAGEAVIVLPADSQVPPDLIAEFLKKWSEGSLVVLAQRQNSAETRSFAAFVAPIIGSYGVWRTSNCMRIPRVTGSTIGA